MSKTKSRVSIVIPVYNEADHLAACLRAIAKQTVQPYEVIVVDNNSTDVTARIAGRYTFVTLLHEPKQGVVHARNRGFDAARGDIIGRLDADSIISDDWVETVIKLLCDSDTDAVTGQVEYYGLAYSKSLSRVDLTMRSWLARRLGREVAMQGANMALRRSAWQAVRTHVCPGGKMHEDFDLSIHLNGQGFTNRFDPALSVQIDCRRLASSYSDFAYYALLSPRTYGQHGLASRRYMYPVVAVALTAYWPLRLLYNGYDLQTDQFLFRQAFASAQSGRVNPATYVD